MKVETNSNTPENTAPAGAAPALRMRAVDSIPRSPSGFPAFEPHRPRRSLTEREKQILRLVCDGLTNAEIAMHLHISRETVKSEMKRIFRKIEVKNRTQAAVVVLKQRMVA